MRLYTFPFAPNPNKLRCYLALKGLELDTVVVNLVHGEQKSAEHLARHPQGKVPVLELDDGTMLTESLVIIEYLEELHPEPPLIGTTPRERAHVRELERIADVGVLLNVARQVHATRSPLGLDPVPEVAAHARAAAEAPLAVLEDRISESGFVAGERPSIADCTLYAAVCFGRFAEIDLLCASPGLRGWLERFERIPGIKL